MGNVSTPGRVKRTIRTGPRCRGQILIITLICLTLLVGLIFYVYDLGTEVNRRVSLQHASDSAAISGSTWMARGMNTVAMNNCEISRLLAMVPIFDSLPQATSMAYAEIAPWEQRLSDQIAASVPETPANYALLMSGLRALQTRFARERDVLTPMNTAFNGGGFDMKSTTWWQGPGGQGSLWQAAAAADSYSRATIESAGAYAQENAVTFGKQNRADVSFLVPVQPQMPVVRATFRDFQPTLEGLERVNGSGATMTATGGRGGAIPDMVYPHRLGPWARLWRWRDYTRKNTEWEWFPPSEGATGPLRGRGNVNVGGRQTGSGVPWGGGGSAGGWRATASEEDGYTTYGPYNWALRLINQFIGGRNGVLSDTHFNDFVNQLSRIKLTYMFTSKNPQSVHDPNWVIDYAQATQIGQTRPDLVKYTMFYLVKVVSSVPPGDARWLTPGTYVTNGNQPIVIWANGWVNPELWGVPKIGNYVWKDSYLGSTTQNLQIGIAMKRDGTGRPIMQTVYMVDWWTWGGIDIGGNDPVANPCNWASEMDLPAPWLLDTSAGDYDPANLNPDQGERRKAFSFLSVARYRAGAPWWQKEFHRPLNDAVTAVAQAKLFNHSSWDLWTQDWQVQLTPVSQWEDWMSQMEQGANEADSTNGTVSRADVQSAYTYLKKLQPLADRWMTH